MTKYLLKDFFTNFMFALGIFTFVLLIGNLVELIQLLLKGVQLAFVFKMIFYITPYLLSYTIPLTCLTAGLLMFGKLSANHEITAMKASGLSLFYISKPVLKSAFVIAVISFIIASYISPSCHYVIRKSKKLDISKVGNINPVKLIEKGVFIEAFYPYVIYCEDKTDNILKDLMIFEVKENSPANTIIAKEGKIKYAAKDKTIKLELKDGSFDAPDPENPENFFRGSFDNYQLEFKLPEKPNKYIARCANDMPISKLLRKIREYEKKGINATPLKVEFSSRLASSVSCIIFTIIAIPLGIKAHRSEKSIGIVLSLGLAMCYYSFIILAKALDKKTDIHPEYIVWIPNIILLSLGIFLFWKTKNK